MPPRIDLRPRKPRTCLRCNKTFSSLGPGHRICDQCSYVNARQGTPTDGTGFKATLPKGLKDD